MPHILNFLIFSADSNINELLFQEIITVKEEEAIETQDKDSKKILDDLCRLTSSL